MVFFSPLEQFEVFNLFLIFSFNYFYLMFTNATFYLLLIFGLIFLYMEFILYTNILFPTKYTVVFEKIYDFIKSLIVDNIGKEGYAYFPLIFLIFLFLLVSNLIGMVPYSFTVTSHITVTFGLALTIFLGINIISIKKHKLKFLEFFLPSGAPLVLAPFFILIELISYVARVFSLSIRLFANMMSGHTLLKIIASFAWTMISLGGIWLIICWVPIFIIIAVTGLELGIACLQAYVYTILLCLYLNDGLHLAH